jgi:hypothetical protein
MVLMAAVSQPLAQAQDKKVGMTFTPEQARFADAAGEYRRIWADEGARMIDALERASGMQFPDMKIEVVIFEGPSISGRGSAPMKLRASYSADVKKGALVHELGHRLNARLRNRPKDLDEHRILFLYLYEAWEQLYGKDFADREVAFEKTLKGLYDYEAAWNWALSMTKEERASKLRELLNSNGGFGFRRF